ncbi:MAG: hypothetical protein AB7J13_08995 [Pyrinomonadaceae bacterium]
MKFETTNRSFNAKIVRTETLILRRGRLFEMHWCDRCERTVRMLRPEDAAPLVGKSARAIYRAIESGQAHFYESCDGRSIFVCFDAIMSSEIGERS